ncbi:MAG: potassium channel family protein [Candidatus Beckwithbacteria bacterium]|nr:potassium channel family protein [Candidatus Beckwithbacteria bacterium]
MSNVIEKIEHDKKLRRYLMALVLLALILGVWVVKFENGHKIRTIGDGLWWALTAVTGGAYGELVPMTLMGRLIGAVLMTVGLVLFSLIVAIFASKIMRYEEKYWTKRIRLEMDSINNKLYRLEQKLDYLIKEKK